MASTITDKEKKLVGGQKIGALLIGVRVPPAGIAELDAWFKKNAPELSP